MQGYMKITVLCCTIISIALFIFFFPYAILPTSSSPHMLTLSYHSSCSVDRVTLRHYINDVHIADHELELEMWLQYQTSQKYKLPQLDEGRVEVHLEFGGLVGNLIVNYEDAKDLYEKGLLVYLTSHGVIDNRYVYLVSKDDQTCYFQEESLPDWSLIDDAPQKLEWITRKDDMIYFAPHNWKTNKWVTKDAME